MSIILRVMWLVTLVMFAGGCSSYRLAPYPGIEDEAAMGVEFESKVEVGDKVKITMTDSSQVEGKVMDVSSEAITLEPERRSLYEKKKYGDSQPTLVKVDRIQTLEVRSPSAGKTWILVGSIIVGSIAILAIGIAASGGVMGN